jgi:hypothetical protein
MPRDAVAHQGVFISSKKVPYGAGLTLMAPPTTDTGQRGNLSDPPPHIFRALSLFLPFTIHILTDPTGLTCRLSEGVSPCRTSTAVVQRHVGLRQIGREGEARASSRWINISRARATRFESQYESTTALLAAANERLRNNHLEEVKAKTAFSNPDSPDDVTGSTVDGSAAGTATPRDLFTPGADGGAAPISQT